MGELSVDFHDVWDVTINNSKVTTLELNGKIAWRDLKRARHLALNLTDTDTRGWSKSSWFFKPAAANESHQEKISNDYFFTNPVNEHCYTTALGGQWLYIVPASEPSRPYQIKFNHPDIGWQFCNADTIAQHGRTYNYVADTVVGAVGWLTWRDPVSTSYTARVWNHTDNKWYNVLLKPTATRPSGPTD